MHDTEKNIYRSCRKKAAERDDRYATIESAADTLNVCERSLYNYELFVTRPPTETVVLMAHKYRTPEMLTYYCAQECPIGRARGMSAPEINSLCQVSIKAISMLQHTSEINSLLLDIAKDGKIDESDIPTVTKVIEWIGGLSEVRTQLLQLLNDATIDYEWRST